MKMFIIVYSEVADEEVINTLKNSGVRAYTKMQEARGEGSETEPKLGTHYWPGKNNILFIAVKNEDVALVNDSIRTLKQEHPKAGIRSFLLPMEEQIP